MMQRAYVSRGKMSRSLASGRMFGKMYSGKTSMFVGVRVLTSMSCDRTSTLAVTAGKSTATHRLRQNPKCQCAHRCGVVGNKRDEVRHKAVEPRLVCQVAVQGEQDLESAQHGCRPDAVADVGADEGEDDERRSVCCEARLSDADGPDLSRATHLDWRRLRLHSPLVRADADESGRLSARRRVSAPGGSETNHTHFGRQAVRISVG